MKLTESVTWVGKIDWDLEKFHGEEYSTFKGTSYNSFLVRDEKTVLIDTVYRPYADDFVRKLKEVIDLNEIDYVIALHGEVDHSGALPKLLEEIPDVPVYCSPQAVKSLQGQYHRNWNFQTVKTGDSLNIGEKTLHFVSANMLHWPDSMFCYMDKENVLFSNDAFGHHYASDLMFNDLVDECDLMYQCLKYYANILTPFNKLVTKKIDEILAMNLPVEYIMPSHGIIWRDKPLQIVQKYQEWAADYQENQSLVFYDTMWENTKIMAEYIAEGIRENSPKGHTVKIMNVGQRDKNEVMTEVFKSQMVVGGCSTINKGILSSMTGVLEMIKGLSFKNKKAASFGSYGWSGESPKIIHEWLEKSGFTMVEEPLKVHWSPDEGGRAACREYGSSLAQHLSK